MWWGDNVTWHVHTDLMLRYGWGVVINHSTLAHSHDATLWILGHTCVLLERCATLCFWVGAVTFMLTCPIDLTLEMMKKVSQNACWRAFTRRPGVVGWCFVRGLLTYPWCIWGYHYAWHGNPILTPAGFHGLTCWVLNTAHIVPQFDSWEMNIGKVVGTFGGTFKDLQLIGHVACLRPSTLNGWPLYS